MAIRLDDNIFTDSSVRTGGFNVRPVNVARKLLLLLYSACGNKIRSSNTEISALCTFRENKTTDHFAYPWLFTIPFLLYVAECPIYDRALHITLRSAVERTIWLFKDSREEERAERTTVLDFHVHLARTIPGKSRLFFGFCKPSAKLQARKREIFLQRLVRS